MALQTLTVRDANHAQVASKPVSSGVVSWGSQAKVKEVYPQFWGAVADNSTNDAVPIQACIDSVMAITSGPKPAIKLIGEFAYTGDIETISATGSLAYGVHISGSAGGRRGDAATIEGLTTLTNTGTGAFYFGRKDDATYRPWMIGSTLENIQFVGNGNVEGAGLYTATNNSIFRNIHITGYTKAAGTTGIGWQRTGELNAFYDCSMTNNYDGGASELGGYASASNNANSYYNVVWAVNTRYGDNPIGENGPNYYNCLWQLNGDSGYYHTSGGKSVSFCGGWFEANNETTAGAQLEFTGTASNNRAKGFQIYGTEMGTLGTEGIASGDGHIKITNTTYARIFPAWDHAPSPPAYQFVNGGANVAMRINQPSSWTGSEGAPYFEQTTNTVSGTSYARFNANDAEIGFQVGEGFGGVIDHYPGTHETGQAYGRAVSDKILGASGNTTAFTITFADTYGSAHFRLRYNGYTAGQLFNVIDSERIITLANNVAAISTVRPAPAFRGDPTTLTFVDGGGGSDTLTDSANGFLNDGFITGMNITITGATTGGNDGTYQAGWAAVVSGTLAFNTGQWAAGEAGVAGMTVVGSIDTLLGSAGGVPAVVWTDNADGTITVLITNNHAATCNGHAVLEFWGGAADAGTGSRGVTITVL